MALTLASLLLVLPGCAANEARVRADSVARDDRLRVQAWYAAHAALINACRPPAREMVSVGLAAVLGVALAASAPFYYPSSAPATHQVTAPSSPVTCRIVSAPFPNTAFANSPRVICE